MFPTRVPLWDKLNIIIIMAGLRSY